MRARREAASFRAASVALATLLLMLGATALAPPVAHGGTSTPLLSLKFGPSEIWQPSTDAVTALHQCQAAHFSCVQPVMQQNGASQDAIAFFQLTGWFLTDIQNSGVVQLGTTLDPWLANENVQPVLLGGTPAVVFPNEHVSETLVEHDPGYATLQADHPNIMFWGVGPRVQPATQSADGGQEFVFDYRLLDGCHACAVLGYARFGLDFAPDGTYESARFLGIQPAGQT